MSTETIEIDFDVHKCIEAERRSFDETPNAVLRRLLNLATTPAPIDVRRAPLGKPWRGKGVELAHGTELRMEYNGVSHTGRIEDGAWHTEGNVSFSPSDAARAVARTRDGHAPSLNGWIYWHARAPGTGNWTRIADLRE